MCFFPSLSLPFPSLPFPFQLFRLLLLLSLLYCILPLPLLILFLSMASSNSAVTNGTSSTEVSLTKDKKEDATSENKDTGMTSSDYYWNSYAHFGTEPNANSSRSVLTPLFQLFMKKWSKTRSEPVLIDVLFWTTNTCLRIRWAWHALKFTCIYCVSVLWYWATNPWA